MLDKGIGIEVIQKILGHSKLETTQIYAQVSDMNLMSVELTI
jgi:site-specific recombinase XerD